MSRVEPVNARRDERPFVAKLRRGPSVNQKMSSLPRATFYAVNHSNIEGLPVYVPQTELCTSSPSSNLTYRYLKSNRGHYYNYYLLVLFDSLLNLLELHQALHHGCEN